VESAGLVQWFVKEDSVVAIPIDDENGKPIGMFAPAPIALKDDVFAEGTPSFFAELERRRQANDRISAEEALRQLRAHGNHV
jgi:hypothetical protein